MTNKTFDLNEIRVASPCPTSWDDMTGDHRVRFCGGCKLNVYNLSAMDRDEAEQLVRNTEKRLCVRFYQRDDGTVLTQDCPVGLRAFVRRTRARIAAVASLVFAFTLGCERPQPAQLPPLQGDVLVPPTGFELGEMYIPDEHPEALMGRIAPNRSQPGTN